MTAKKTTYRTKEKGTSQSPEFNDSIESLRNEAVSLILETSGIGMMLWDFETGHLSWDERICEFWGVKPGTPPSKELFFKAIHPDDHECVRKQVEEVSIKKPGIHSIQYRVKGINSGVERWLQVNNRLYFRENKPAGLIGIASDITAFKKASRELEAEESKFKNVFESANAGKSITRISGELNVNKAFCDILGYTEEELKNIKWQEITPPEEVPVLEEMMKPVLNGEKDSVRFTKRYIHKNGSYIWSDVSVVLHRDKHGRPDYYITTMIDITDLKKTEITLQNSEEKFSILFNKASLPAALSNAPKFEFADANDAWIELFGFKLDEIIGKTSEDLGISRDQDHRSTVIKELQKKKSIRNMEQVLYKKSGEAMTVLTNIDYLKIGEDEFALTSLQDITEKKKAETLLKDSEQRFSSMFRLSPFPISLSKMEDSKFTEVNDAWCRFTGFKKEEVIGKTVEELGILDPENRELIGRELGEKKSVKGLELTIQTKDGKIKNLLTYLEPLSIGSDVFVMNIIVDITDQKKAELSLKESEERYRNLLEMAPIGIAVHSEGKVVFTNPAGARLLGVNSPRELIGKSIFEIIHPDHMEKSRQRIGRMLAGEKGLYPAEDIYRKVNGESLHVEVMATMITYEGKPAVQVLVSDISERKKAREELILAKEKAEESDRLKTAFLQNISHEIRTPMNGILGFANLLHDAYLSLEKRENYLKIINESGERMLITINDIIEMSKLQTGQMIPRSDTADVTKIIDSIYNFYLQKAREKNLTIRKYTEDSQQVIVETDKTKLEAILNNLIENALKFTDKGSIEFGYRIVNADLEFFVSDSGIGIPDDMKEMVFERFAQVDPIRDSDMPGMGLGLAISKAYTELLGGKIWVEPGKETGSVFYFTIPFKMTTPEKVTEESVFETDLNGLNILIAEDDMMNMELFSELFESTGATILKAYTGKEAVQLAENTVKLDLILMDIKMPDLDGYSALAMIKTIKPDIPVIAQTSYAMSNDRERALKSGFDEYISKPIDFNELIAKIRKLIA